MRDHHEIDVAVVVPRPCGAAEPTANERYVQRPFGEVVCFDAVAGPGDVQVKGCRAVLLHTHTHTRGVESRMKC